MTDACDGGRRADACDGGRRADACDGTGLDGVGPSHPPATDAATAAHGGG